MDLSSASKYKITEEEKQRRRANNLCLRCGGRGHIARDCHAGPPRGAGAARNNSQRNAATVNAANIASATPIASAAPMPAQFIQTGPQPLSIITTLPPNSAYQLPPPPSGGHQVAHGHQVAYVPPSHGHQVAPTYVTPTPGFIYDPSQPMPSSQTPSAASATTFATSAIATTGPGPSQTQLPTASPSLYTFPTGPNV